MNIAIVNTWYLDYSKAKKDEANRVIVAVIFAESIFVVKLSPVSLVPPVVQWEFPNSSQTE